MENKILIIFSIFIISFTSSCEDILGILASRNEVEINVSNQTLEAVSIYYYSNDLRISHSNLESNQNSKINFKTDCAYYAEGRYSEKLYSATSFSVNDARWIIRP